MTKKNNETAQDALPIKDITRAATVRWPHNGRGVVATQYVLTRFLLLKKGQKGYLLTTPLGFVCDRVDIHALNDEANLSIGIVGEDGQILAAADIADGTSKPLTLKGRHKVNAGELYSTKKIYIENLGEELNKRSEGKIAITFSGYHIELWR